MTADLMYPLLFLAVVVMTLVWSFAQWRVRRHSIRYQAAFAHQAARERVERARQEAVRASEQLAQARATGAAVDVLLSRYATPRELTSTGQRAA